MKGLRALLVGAVASASLIAGSVPASAGPDAPTIGFATATGSGTIAPGLTAIPAPQTFSLSGAMTFTGVCNGVVEVLTPSAISGSGSDLAGSYAEGAGTLTVDTYCTENPMAGYFARVGDIVAFSVSRDSDRATGTCLFIAAQTPPAPVTAYSVTCAAVFSYQAHTQIAPRGA